MNGLVLIDKPGGCTSHDVVNRWRRLAGTRSVGHLGTLDPMATGLLVLLTGKATRLAQFFERETKTYQAEVLFGYVSSTYDVEGEMLGSGEASAGGLADIERELAAFRGKFLQTPPAVSAKKVGGVRAYKLAREQKPVELKPVPVEIRQLDITGFDGKRLGVTVTCSAGTYIRSLAHDLGVRLGCGGVLSALRRTRVGDLKVEDAFTFERLDHLAESGRLCEAIHPSRDLLPEFPAVYVDQLTEVHIRQGRDFRTSPFVAEPGTARVKALNRDGELIAIADMVLPNVYHPAIVL